MGTEEPETQEEDQDSNLSTQDAATAESQEAVTIGHITITPKDTVRILAECSKCGMGVDIGEKFGFIPGEVMLAEWIKLHAHRPKAKRKSGVVDHG